MYTSNFHGFGSSNPDTAAEGEFKGADAFFEGWETEDDRLCNVRIVLAADDLGESHLQDLLREFRDLLNPPVAHRLDSSSVTPGGFTYLSSWSGHYGPDGPKSSLEITKARDAEQWALRDQNAVVIAVSHEKAIGLGAVNPRRREVYYLYQHFRTEANFSESLTITPEGRSTALAIDEIPGARVLPIRRDVKGLAVSPDGSSIAVYEVNVEGGDSGRLAIIDLATNARRLLTTFDRGYYGVGLSFSPDGQWLLLNTRVWPTLIHVGSGWSAPLTNVTGPTCWWQINGTSALLEVGEFESQTAKVIDPGRMFAHDLTTGERLELGKVKYPDNAGPENRRELRNPIAGADERVLVGINYDVENENDVYLYRVAVLDPATGDITTLVDRFADSERQIERVHEGWAWNTPLQGGDPIEINDHLLGQHRAASLDADTSEEYAHWNLLALDFDSPLLTGKWDK